MTRLAILADVHGNLPALEAVARDLAQYEVERVIVAGDVINWGPFSAQVLEWITRAGWAVIRGNNEFYLLDHGTPRAPAEWNDREQYSLLPWLHRQLQGEWQTAIATWPDSLSLRFPDAPPLRIVHGTPRSPWEPIYPDVTEAELGPLMADVGERTLVAGHTHLPMDRHVGGWHILNPGSVGVPVDGTFDASYLLLDGDTTGWRASFRQVSFDREPLYAEYARQGFLEECGVIGQLVLDEIRTARLKLFPFICWRRACCPDRPITAELLAEFERLDPRCYSPAAYWSDAPKLSPPP